METVPLQPPSDRPTSYIVQQKNNTILWIFLFIFMGIIVYLGYSRWQLQQEVLRYERIVQVDYSPSSFDECARLKDSIIQESYPAVCITKDGQRFTQIILSPSPDQTISWVKYVNPQWEFSIQFPPDVFVECMPNDPVGLKLWRTPFECVEGHDIFYEVGATGMPIEAYKEYKSPASMMTVAVNGIFATKKIYTLDESDGPLSSFGQMTEVIFQTDKGVISVQHLGNQPDQQELFDQILSTFIFVD